MKSQLLTFKSLAIALSIFGLLISIYLTWVKLFNTSYVCGISSCDLVNNSIHAYFLGIPVSIHGIAFYLLLLGLLFLEKKLLLRILVIIGLGFSAYLTYIEAFVLHAWCQWCLFSAWIVLALFIISIKIDFDDV